MHERMSTKHGRDGQQVNSESDYFWRLIRIRMQDQFFTFINTGRYEHFTIHCDSPGGDAAAALSHRPFYTIYIQSPEGDNATTLAELRSLSAFVVIIIIIITTTIAGFRKFMPERKPNPLTLVISARLFQDTINSAYSVKACTRMRTDDQ